MSAEASNSHGFLKDQYDEAWVDAFSIIPTALILVHLPDEQKPAPARRKPLIWFLPLGKLKIRLALADQRLWHNACR
jgi:hypothetical protein